VSPSWRDRVSVFLAPGEVHLARHARGWKPAPGIGQTIECDKVADNAWQPALDALGRALSRLGWQGADARVTVSNHFVRYALVPSAAKLRGEIERAAAARHALRATYGERGDGWHVVLDEALDGAAVAAAIEPALIEGLSSALHAAKLRPTAIEPFLATAFNACRGSIRREPAWIAAAEPGRVCVGYLDRGAWQLVRNERLRARLEDEFPAVLERCRLSAGVDAGAGRVLLVSREDPQVELVDGSGWTLERVRLGEATVTPLAA
jgi:hypothetical protein